MFVRDKNTQKLEENAYLIQVVSLNMNMNSILKLIQRFKHYNIFLIFSRILLLYILFFVNFLSRRKFNRESHNLTFDGFLWRHT